MLSYMPSIVSM